MNEQRDLVSSRLVFGVAMLAVGVLLTLGNLDVINAWAVLRYWPVLLLFWGVMRLTGFCCARRPMTGAILLVVGIYLQARMLYGGWLSSLDVLAILLVVAGAAVLIGPSSIRYKPGIYVGSIDPETGRRIRRRIRVSLGRIAETIDRSVETASSGATTGGAGTGATSAPGAGAAAGGATGGMADDDPRETVDARDRLSVFAFLGNVARKVTSQSFRGGDAGAVLGGVEIDLRPARIAGDEAVIDVTTFMGGVDIRVPDGWRVSGETTTLLGSFTDKTRVPASDARVTLHVRGVAILGAVEIKN